LQDRSSFFNLSEVLTCVVDMPLNRSFEKIDFALALAKATMTINTISYFIAMSINKVKFYNLPFGIALIFNKKIFELVVF